jgi:hypothetical protein
MPVQLTSCGICFGSGATQHKCRIEEMGEIYVFNPNHWSPQNGGQCCAFSVPTGVTSIKFEILSGGGPGGSSGGDYDHGIGGNGGSYGVKTLQKSVHNFTDGTVYTVCAAGTSDCSCCCSCNMNCRHGCTSYVNGTGLSNFCAIGGMGGTTQWDMTSQCYNCFWGNLQCSVGNYNAGWANYACNTPVYGSDMCFYGTTGSYNRQYDCCADAFGVAGAPAGPISAQHGISGKHMCIGNLACCTAHAAFPGGGGPGHATAAVDACWGSFGAGGLVRITYS